MTTTNERLTEMLDKKDEELSEAAEKIERLERELEGSLNGWRQSAALKDDGLPLPRLELVYVQRREWNDYEVLYRMVYRHLLGEIIGIPLGRTKIQGGRNAEPVDLPFRDGAHAAHDAAHLGLPCYRIVPGHKPEPIDFSDHDRQQATGRKQRRT